jgi:hypothetical protein
MRAARWRSIPMTLCFSTTLLACTPCWVTRMNRWVVWKELSTRVTATRTGWRTTPIWIRHRGRVQRKRRLVLLGVALAFAVLVIVGYAADLKWTGFPGNNLLGLVLAPDAPARDRAISHLA